jgi:RNA polymerase sigma factor (sigma-70 family)
VGSPGVAESWPTEEILRILDGFGACRYSAASDAQHSPKNCSFLRRVLLATARRFTSVPSEVIERDLAQLVERVAVDRDRAAFEALYDHFASRIYAFLLRSNLEPAIAEDLTQEVMTKLWLRAKQFNPDISSVPTWLFRIARNAKIDYQRRLRGDAPLEEALAVPDTSQTPDEALNVIQWEERVRAALTNLPAEQLAMVKLAFFEGLTHSEIARQTGIPLGTVKARIRLALRRLRLSL